MIRDSEYILEKLIETIGTSKEEIDIRLVNGHIMHIEDYKYNLGMRFILDTLQKEIKELSRSN